MQVVFYPVNAQWGMLCGPVCCDVHGVCLTAAEDQAEAAMKLVNGYMMRGRPVIIQFGKRKS